MQDDIGGKAKSRNHEGPGPGRGGAKVIAKHDANPGAEAQAVVAKERSVLETTVEKDQFSRAI